MPKKTKDLKIKEEDKQTKKSSKKTITGKKATSKKTENTTTKATKKVTKPVKASTKKAANKAVEKVAKPAKALAKKAANKTTENVALSVQKKQVSSKSSSAKKPSSLKGSRKTASQKNSTSRKKNSTIKTKEPEILEYYDLPYRYNQTVVRILAQTPNTLFVYWDISDVDRKKYIDKFGENFFNNTYPVLIIHNKTMNYSFEIEINDFANSWYFNVNDAKCEYEIELGRRSKQDQTEVNLPYNYEHITSSNVIEAPNNHILFEKAQKILFFRNVKTNKISEKDISSFDFMKYMGQIYNVYSIYQKIYKQDELQYLKDNPSSGFKIM